MFIFFRTVVEMFGRAALYVMTKGVRFFFLWLRFQSFLTWDDTCPVNFFFNKLAAVSS